MQVRTVSNRTGSFTSITLLTIYLTLSILYRSVEVGINKQVKCIRYPRMPKVPSKPEKPSILGVTYRVDYTVMIPTPHFPRDFNGLLCTFLEKNDTFYNTTVDVCGSEFYSVDGNGK